MPNVVRPLNVSRKTPLTSKRLLLDSQMSWVIDRDWFVQESAGLNPDGLGKISLFSKIYFSKTFLRIGSRDTWR